MKMHGSWYEILTMAVYHQAHVQAPNASGDTQKLVAELIARPDGLISLLREEAMRVSEYLYLQNLAVYTAHI